MAGRKGWENLSDTTRRRYERAGVTKSAYESGVSLKKARGHENTPERPTQKISRQEFPEYFSKRHRLEVQFQHHKEELFRDRPKWDAEKSWKNIRSKPVGVELLQWACNATAEELEDALRTDRETFRFVGYH